MSSSSSLTSVLLTYSHLFTHHLKWPLSDDSGTLLESIQDIAEPMKGTISCSSSIPTLIRYLQYPITIKKADDPIFFSVAQFILQNHYHPHHLGGSSYSIILCTTPSTQDVYYFKSWPEKLIALWLLVYNRRMKYLSSSSFPPRLYSTILGINLRNHTGFPLYLTRYDKDEQNREMNIFWRSTIDTHYVTMVRRSSCRSQSPAGDDDGEDGDLRWWLQCLLFITLCQIGISCHSIPLHQHRGILRILLHNAVIAVTDDVDVQKIMDYTHKIRQKALLHLSSQKPSTEYMTEWIIKRSSTPSMNTLLDFISPCIPPPSRLFTITGHPQQYPLITWYTYRSIHNILVYHCEYAILNQMKDDGILADADETFCFGMIDGDLPLVLEEMKQYPHYPLQLFEDGNTSRIFFYSNRKNFKSRQLYHQFPQIALKSSAISMSSSSYYFSGASSLLHLFHVLDKFFHRNLNPIYIMKHAEYCTLFVQWCRKDIPKLGTSGGLLLPKWKNIQHTIWVLFLLPFVPSYSIPWSWHRLYENVHQKKKNITEGATQVQSYTPTCHLYDSDTNVSDRAHFTTDIEGQVGSLSWIYGRFSNDRLKDHLPWNEKDPFVILLMGIFNMISLHFPCSYEIIHMWFPFLTVSVGEPMRTRIRTATEYSPPPTDLEFALSLPSEGIFINQQPIEDTFFSVYASTSRHEQDCLVGDTRDLVEEIPLDRFTTEQTSLVRTFLQSKNNKKNKKRKASFQLDLNPTDSESDSPLL